VAQIALAREPAERGQPRVPRRILAFTNVVIAGYEAQRQIHHLVQALRFDQIVFLCRAIERDVAGMQHEIGANVCNVLGRFEEIGNEIGLVERRCLSEMCAMRKTMPGLLATQHDMCLKHVAAARHRGGVKCGVAADRARERPEIART
jgi:hypothetical protein